MGYDIVAPLQYVGKEAYRKDYEEFLAQYNGPIDIEYRDFRIVASGSVAFIHALERMSGTLKNGQKSDMWVRATSGLRKINGKWMSGLEIKYGFAGIQVNRNRDVVVHD